MTDKPMTTSSDPPSDTPMFPYLSTDRLILDELRDEDITALYEIFSDATVLVPQYAGRNSATLRHTSIHQRAKRYPHDAPGVR